MTREAGRGAAAAGLLYLIAGTSRIRVQEKAVTMTVPSVFNHTIQQTQEWLKTLIETGGLPDERRAYAAPGARDFL